jgi:hypothetical protein
MCIQHWKLVPVELQKAVWTAYVTGQEERKDPTPAYLAVAKAAVRAVQDARVVRKASLADERAEETRRAIANSTLLRPETGDLAGPLFSPEEAFLVKGRA